MRILKKLEELGRFFAFLGELLRVAFAPPIRWGRYMTEIEHLGIRSISIILLSGGAIGMIFALQLVGILQIFNAEIGAGAVTAVAMAREMAPVITTLMLIAKNGSAMAAELGTMKVTEQIDAMESMSVNVVQYLVLPKVAASLLVFPTLTLLANMIGAIGSYGIAVYLHGIEPGGYLDYMFNMLIPTDVISGLIKALVMGFITATVCCYCGLNAAQGAKGVGEGANKAVVVSSVSILVADYILATVMMRF
ncbi:MAG: ABC transporter permease [Spirochaetaceae bacterium]|jgi:phospholipid/cholesterol/gamma-HCH transport system permease protein|nr:ABC transporter permease [Spirochaetaceae bacterium]